MYDSLCAGEVRFMARDLYDLSKKSTGYYENIREDMFEYIPRNVQTTLEFGCGCGGFSALLKSRLGVEAWAVEIEEQSANVASQKLDKVLKSGALESLDKLPETYFDCIIFFDVLEHLIDPYSILKAMKTKLTGNGVIVASIPNIRYYRAFKKYVLHGDWDYEDHGVLDKTHLRFFTYKSIVKLFEQLGFDILELQGIHPTSSLTFKLLNIIALNYLSDIRYKHFAVVVKPKFQDERSK